MSSAEKMPAASSSAVAVPINTQGRSIKVELVERSNGRPGGVALVDAYRVGKHTEAGDLVELAQQVQKADEFVRARAVGKLELIAEQMRHLQEQARRVLSEAKRDDELHHAACNMKKMPGQIYAMYERPSGQRYFSMLTPEEWGPECPHKFLGTYRLEHDMSWTPAEKMAAREREISAMDQILDANRTFEPAIQAGSYVPKSLRHKAVLDVEGPIDTQNLG